MHGVGLLRSRSASRTREAARQFFTDGELRRASIEGKKLRIADASFKLDGTTLAVDRVPDDHWLRAHLATLSKDEAVWELVAFVKVRRLATAEEIVERARSGDLYDESYFTKRGGGAPYVGYPRELNGFEGNFDLLASEIIGRFAPSRSLDIGCATGHLVRALRNAGTHAEGIDFSQWAVDHAVTPVTQGSAMDLPWDENEFDLAISQDFMEHMHPDDLPKVIAEQVRVVRRGGTIAHLIPFYESDPPVQVDAHLCQATQEWWMRFLRAQPCIEIVREPVDSAPAILDRYVELRRV